MHRLSLGGLLVALGDRHAASKPVGAREPTHAVAAVSFIYTFNGAMQC